MVSGGGYTNGSSLGDDRTNANKPFFLLPDFFQFYFNKGGFVVAHTVLEGVLNQRGKDERCDLRIARFEDADSVRNSHIISYLRFRQINVVAEKLRLVAQRHISFLVFVQHIA